MCKANVKGDLTIFENADFGKIRVVIRNGKPWFVAVDVANALGFANSSDAIKRHCKKVNKIKHSETLGSEINIIPESDLYRLAMRSNTPKAADFQTWVVEEVLPSIRKTGSYGNFAVLPQDYASALRALADKHEQLELAQGQVNEYRAKIWEQHPYVVFSKAIRGAKGATDVGGLAKIIRQSLPVDIGRNRLYSWLRENGWVLKKGKDKFTPSQKSTEKGLMKLKFVTVQVGKTTYTKPVLQITPRGIEFFFREFQKMLIV